MAYHLRRFMSVGVGVSVSTLCPYICVCAVLLFHSFVIQHIFGAVTCFVILASTSFFCLCKSLHWLTFRCFFQTFETWSCRGVLPLMSYVNLEAIEIWNGNVQCDEYVLFFLDLFEVLLINATSLMQGTCNASGRPKKKKKTWFSPIP